ncbi:putative gtp binding protein [Schistosoma mansoni]|uniref:putative gtp binding protein n=1 Tax=Schistosoma mansoni TaxID=6183 RepID=UPI00022DC654|nr:putative gtp binding protein [Schistosoma mansoni]|eukprot:XP_018653009.1 putative gtp binding protein [Schistosoma mansoni]
MVKCKFKNAISHAKHSLNPDREKQPKGSTMRTKATIKRLNMYRNFKAKRNKNGKIVRPAPFQSTLPSGTVARVEPNRRWFGNTRVISQDTLQSFKEAMKIRNPYEIILRQTRLPISLLDEKKTKTKSALLTSQSYSYVFGGKAQRKRPSLEFDDLSSLVRNAESNQYLYSSTDDKHMIRCDDGVLDSSDVVLYILDARDPMGTRSPYIEKYLKTEKPHKHFIFIINKVDLVPVWITKRWKAILSEEYPTLIFHADMTKPLGKVALMGLLRQLASLHSKERPQISVGIIGYPNVGKSSIINALRNKKVCNVAPLAGETKVWQYVTLMKSIFLIDCPGVVYPDGNTEAELVMKGVVRVEYLQQPDLYIRDVLERVKPEFLQAKYNLPPLSSNDVQNYLQKQIMDNEANNESSKDINSTLSESSTKPLLWNDYPELFLETLARQSGKLLKAGEPDLNTTAKRVLNDFQRGRLPYFVKPPMEAEELKQNDVIDEYSEEIVKDLSVDVPDKDQSITDVISSTDTGFTEDLSETDCSDGELESSKLLNYDLNTNDVNVKAIKTSKEPVQTLTSRQKRSMDRAIRRQKNRAGRQFYKEIRDQRPGRNYGSNSQDLRKLNCRSKVNKRR